MSKRLVAAALMATAAAIPVLADDFGRTVDAMLAAQSMALFGIAEPLAAAALDSPETGYRKPTDTAADLVALASGLSAEILTREAGNDLDMFTLFPAVNPTHLIACIEGDREEIAPGVLNPGVQRISLADGAVETIVRGTSACDGIRTTPWGTILFTEEEDDGLAYEIFDPLKVAEVAILDRATGATTDEQHVVVRRALPTMAWEGIGITAAGVVYAGDELRPGTGNPDADGGAMFKFIPDQLYMGGAVTSPEQSPFASGRTFAMQVTCQGNRLQFGQGCEIGRAAWIEVDPLNARSEADAAGATGYYRPEDLHLDPVYAGEGARFCFANTGNERARNYGEIMCAIDLTPAIVVDGEGRPALTTEINRFWEGDLEANAFDNLEFQPGTGILFVIEDHDNGDVWACLPDGADRDIKTDGCIRVLSVKDTSAEPTGFLFSADGMTAYLAIQHSDDTNMPLVGNYGTDDLIVITGFRAPQM